MTIIHKKVSTIPDAGDSTLVQPSDWNASHVIDISVSELNDHTTVVHNALNIDAFTFDNNLIDAFSMSGHLHSYQASGIFVNSFNARTGVVLPVSGDYPWSYILTSSNLAGLTSRSHLSLTEIGILTHSTLDSYLNQAVLTSSMPSFKQITSIAVSGTQPFLCSSPTLNTNLNADLLDGLHDTGFTKTTAGQTINVTTAAELTAALAGLTAAPSLLGNVIISLAAGTYAGSFTIPSILSNGYSITIEGNTTDDDTGNVSSSTNNWSTNDVTVVDNTKAWGVNTYAGKLLELNNDPLDIGGLMWIRTNTATVLSPGASHNLAPATYKIKTLNTTIQGNSSTTVINNLFDNTIIKNIIIDGNNTASITIDSNKATAILTMYGCEIYGATARGIRSNVGLIHCYGCYIHNSVNAIYPYNSTNLYYCCWLTDNNIHILQYTKTDAANFRYSYFENASSPTNAIQIEGGRVESISNRVISGTGGVNLGTVSRHGYGRFWNNATYTYSSGFTTQMVADASTFGLAD